jgi:hypothetical protein
VLLFAYARPDHLRRTVEALQGNAEATRTDLIVYCDAAKTPRQQEAVDAVRAVAASITGFASVEVVHRPRNFGLAQSIIGGVSDTLARRGRVIVVEDDLVVSPHFLAYMNQGLDLYARDDRVASVHGYCYPTGEDLPESFFQRGADCWGWATWDRAWRHFNPDGAALLAQLRARGLTRAFDLDGSHPFTRMLQDQVDGRNNSWAIRWHASAFLADMLTLYPGRSLVENIGHDDSGTHCGTTDVFGGAASARPVRLERIPLEDCRPARDAFKRFHRRHQGLRQRARTLVADLMALGR